MAYSSTSSKVRFLTTVLDHISDAQLETLEIISDVDQMTQLMTGMLEAKSGQIVSMNSAFADL